MQTQSVPSLDLSPWKSLFVGRDFGAPGILKPTESVTADLFNRDALGPPADHSEMGTRLQQILKDTYGVDHPLRHDLAFGLKAYPLAKSTVYCAGQRVSDRFVYDRVSMDPITLVRKEFEKTESDNAFDKWAGTGGALLFGAISAACFGYGSASWGGGGERRR